MKLKELSFLADENIQSEVVDFLRQSGLKIQTVKDVNLLGHDDEVLLRFTHSHDMAVLTHDSDFASLAIVQGVPFVAILRIRPGHINPSFTIDSLKHLLAKDIDIIIPSIITLSRRNDKITIRIRQ